MAGAFRAGRLGALGDLPRSAPPRKITDAKVEEVVTRTLEKNAAPGHALEHAHDGRGERTESQNAIVRIWRAFGSKPICRGTSGSPPTHSWWRAGAQRDSRSDVLPKIKRQRARYYGALLKSARADRTVVLCVDEKNQVQALNRSPPRGCRCARGRPSGARTMTIRHGTASLFAALDVAPGKIIG